MGRLKTLCIVIMISLFSLSAIAYGEIAWTTKRLTWTDGLSEHPAIAVNGSNIYVVYQDDYDTPGKSDIYLKQSADGGVTWVWKRLSRTTGICQHPAITVDGQNIYVLWDFNPPYGGDYEITLKQSADGGTTWERQGLTWRDSYSITPDIAVNGLNIYVIWRESSLSHTSWAIYLKRSTDGGVTWTYENLSGFGHLEAPKISFNGSNVYAVWQASYGYSGGISFRKSIDGGETWEALQTLSDSATGPFYSEPAIAVEGQNIYVVWSRRVTQTNNDIFLIKSTDGGATWEAEKRLSHTANLSLMPAIAVNGQNIYVVWEERLDPSEIYFTQSTDGGTIWDTEKRLTWTAYSSIDPKIAVENSNIYVVWAKSTPPLPSNFEIFLKKGVLY